MTAATREATIEEYMELVKEGDHDKVVNFIMECFGSDDDYNCEECDKFADEVEPHVTAFLKEEIAKMPEATPEMMNQVEAQAEAARDAEVCAVEVAVEEAAEIVEAEEVAPEA